ncbi:MAG: bifunctional biotin--[acetyl-CoA-carboxylase] ligase/biotin operon repressor BirA [Steroidobacteraceae bacterium]
MKSAVVPLVARVFSALASGEFTSGEALAERLGVSRSAVWKATGTLKTLGATLHAVRNRGYRLVAGGEPLDAGRIRARLPREIAQRVRKLDVAWSVDSTNTVLLARPNPSADVAEVLLAEFQTQGRGRRGRSWIAPPGGAICLSLSWTFQQAPEDLGALGLAVGVCVLRALREFDLEGVALKWPNDILIDRRKLGGILIDMRGESAGPACVVIGLGLNVALGSTLLRKIATLGLPATDLVTAGMERPCRNSLTAAVIAAIVPALPEFERQGLRPFVEEWRSADVLHGRTVDVHLADGVARGTARGIDVHGALLIETPQGVRRYMAGDVTVRP